ncbi:MAG TPA: GAF domain-containing protein [Salinivirgaceae bacterium]|nr:GAF domain-containing protein [Salinivirgaceae bacterium]
MKKRHGVLQKKFQIPIFIAIIVVFGISISFIVIKTYHATVKNAKTLVNSVARENANRISKLLEHDLAVTRTFGKTLVGYLENNSNLIDLTLLTLKKSLEKNDDIYSTWISYQLNAIDTSWDKERGRRELIVYRNKNSFVAKDQKLDLIRKDSSTLYYTIKANNEEIITDPRLCSYSDDKEAVFVTSICVPLLINNQFVGLAGVDITLERFATIINSIKPFKETEATLFSNEGQIIASSQKDIVNKANRINSGQINIIDSIKNSSTFSFETKVEDKKLYVVHIPIDVREISAKWSLQITVPLDTITKESKESATVVFLIGLAGIVVLSVIVWRIIHSKIQPIYTTINVLKSISEGDLTTVSKFNINSGDELEDMSNSINALIDSLKQIYCFTKDIGEGKLDAEYKLFNQNDVIGLSLIEMQNSLKKAEDEDKQRRIEDDKQSWISQGIATFGDILRQDNISIEQLTFNIISKLVSYVDVQQGCIYIINDDNEVELQNPDEIYYEIKAAVAFDKRKLLKDKVYMGEGLVGRCAHEKLTTYLAEVPDGYVHINSGLGESNPGSVLLVPLLLNQQVFGVIELVSFKPIEQYKIEFVEKIAESIASTLSNAKINEKTKKLLIESQKQREELASQEEEMRQNLEELQATQEDASRREAEMRSLWKVFGHIALIIEYDTEFKVISVNEKCQEYFGDIAENIINTPHQLLGFVDDRDSVGHATLLQKLKRGGVVERHSNLVTRVTNKWLYEIYAPLYDNDDNIIRYVSVGIDVSILDKS